MGPTQLRVWYYYNLYECVILIYCIWSSKPVYVLNFKLRRIRITIQEDRKSFELNSMNQNWPTIWISGLLRFRSHRSQGSQYSNSSMWPWFDHQNEAFNKNCWTRVRQTVCYVKDPAEKILSKTYLPSNILTERWQQSWCAMQH